MTEGTPFQKTVLAGGGALAGVTIGGVSVGTIIEYSTQLVTQVQIALLVVAGAIIITAEVGVILIVVQYLRFIAMPADRPRRTRAPGPPNALPPA
jgi:hypothetical protein